MAEDFLIKPAALQRPRRGWPTVVPPKRIATVGGSRWCHRDGKRWKQWTASPCVNGALANCVLAFAAAFAACFAAALAALALCISMRRPFCLCFRRHSLRVYEKLPMESIPKKSKSVWCMILGWVICIFMNVIWKWAVLVRECKKERKCKVACCLISLYPEDRCI